MFLHFKLNVIWSVSHCIIVDYANSCSRFFKNGKFGCKSAAKVTCLWLDLRGNWLLFT